ncbi:MAG TPA: hemerythrin domain-containing protein [bacterium]|jgi:hemerythrin-like domain-containing protein
MDLLTHFDSSRREFLRAGGLIAAATFTLRPATLLAQAIDPKPAKKKEEKLPPTEDLMREHGLLSRVLLIYDEAENRLTAGKAFPMDALAAAAGIVRRFVEDYHERNEEAYVFPRLNKPGGLPDLVRVLLDQHNAGRQLTGDITRLALAGTPKTDTDRAQIAYRLKAFNRMYRPHKAREDTVLFPALRDAMSEHELHQLGDTFEKQETQLFGEDGFEKVLDEVDALEKRLGLNDLAQYTPKG